MLANSRCSGKLLRKVSKWSMLDVCQGTRMFDLCIVLMLIINAIVYKIKNKITIATLLSLTEWKTVKICQS